MKKCYIITSYIEGELSDIISPDAADFIICADGGYELASAFGVVPDLIIGDSDSGNMTPSPCEKPEVLIYPKEKDESDTFLCVKHAASLGFNEIVIAGGIGGRLDHTVSNIQTLAYFSDSVKSISMIDGKNFATILSNGCVKLSKKEGHKISLFSLTNKSGGVTAAGLLYPLKDACLENTYPLGLSNEFVDNIAEIEVKSGKILIVMSK